MAGSKTPSPTKPLCGASQPKAHAAPSISGMACETAPPRRPYSHSTSSKLVGTAVSSSQPAGSGIEKPTAFSACG
eukprot:8453706-Alexandrium_andersonii.AAC.1